MTALLTSQRVASGPAICSTGGGRIATASARSPAPVFSPSDVENAEELGGTALRSQPEGESFAFAVLGDLHLEPDQMDLFDDSRRQVLRHMKLVSESDSGTLQDPVSHVRLFQLGDVGGYASRPGSRACFSTAVDYLDGFGIQRLSVTGNHDLEGTEFETDEENLAAWRDAFGQHHFWALEMGTKTVCIGLSTVRFRNTDGSCHEVFVDEEQLAWFQNQLQKYADRNVFVFTHAPPMGSGLTSLQGLHVRNRCAWLNHSSSHPGVFLDLVRSHPNIKLWFSGHFHLSHDYEGSVSRVGNCLFVQTGVMGRYHRDGRRHTRVVKGDAEGYRLFTLDHGPDRLKEAQDEAAARGIGYSAPASLLTSKVDADGSAAEAEANGSASATPPVTLLSSHVSTDGSFLRLDVVHSYSNERERGMPPQRAWCSTLSLVKACPGGGLFSPSMPQDIRARDAAQYPPSAMQEEGESGAQEKGNDSSSALGDSCRKAGAVQWIVEEGQGLVLAVNGNQVVQYDLSTRAPVGLLTEALNGRELRLVREGEEVVAVDLIPVGTAAGRGGEGKAAAEAERLWRNKAGGFWKVYQLSKWKARRAAAVAAAAAPGGSH